MGWKAYSRLEVPNDFSVHVFLKFFLASSVCLCFGCLLSIVKDKGSLLQYFPFERTMAFRYRVGTCPDHRASYYLMLARLLLRIEGGGCTDSDATS